MSSYEFIDVDEYQNKPLSAEALSVNGIVLETEIPGFRTLTTSGRESVEREIQELSAPTQDGARIHTKKLLPRTIKVTFQLIAPSDTAFREAVNKLNGYLTGDELQLVFADEPDKYFTGCLADITDMPSGTNKIRGTMEFYCADPLKYALETRSCLMDSTTHAITVDYRGTYPARPLLFVSPEYDLGFCAFADEQGHTIRIGNADAGTQATENVSVVSIDDMCDTSIPSGWTLNAANLGTEGSGYAQNGTLKVETERYHGICANSYGSGSGWHGTGITKAIPADQTEAVGAQNFKAEFKHFLTTGSFDDIGRLMLIITDGTGNTKKNIATIDLYKWKTAVNDGQGRIYVNGKELQRFNFTCDWYNKVTGSPVAGKNSNAAAGNHSIEKFGSKITFRIAGRVYSFTVSGIENMKATEVSVFFGTHGAKTGIRCNVLQSVRFTWLNAQSYYTIANPLHSGDVIECDCLNGEISVLGVPHPELGDVRNDWEGFMLMPGEQLINCAWSEWYDTRIPPYCGCEFREAWL